MKLSKLVSSLDVENTYTDEEISYITFDSRKCIEGSAFVCMKGEHVDGHDKVREAIENGAKVIIAQRDTKEKNQIIVKDTKKAYALMCCEFFDNPSKKLQLIGVTGTNGKTTVAHSIYRFLMLCQRKTSLIGTIKNILPDKVEDSMLTTPDAFEFNRLLSEAVKLGCEYCVCEVSSQALDLERTYGCDFEIGVFTNISKEHLDYHKTMENYIAAKKKLFSQCKNIVANLDDSYFDALFRDTQANITTYSAQNDESFLTAKSIRINERSVDYAAVSYSQIGRVHFNMTGLFSVYNSLAVLGCALVLGFDFDESVSILPLIEPPTGRMEELETGRDFRVIIDYAHTPDGLLNVLSALGKNKKGRIITVFGCGGNRDKEKRPLMGDIVSQLSDITIVTSDNPRNEERESIINDILDGIGKNKNLDKLKKQVFVRIHRTQAIELALDLAKKDDIVLLAGKGHETYQIVGDEKILFDERKKVLSYLAKN